MTDIENSDKGWETAESRMDIIGHNGNDGGHYSTPDEEEELKAIQKRMEIIGQNGGTGEHYEKKSLEERYPQYYKSVRHLEFVDVYQVHNLFSIEDWSGCIQHASKKLLLSGVRTGGKTKRQDIEEARDTLTRWLELEQNQ